MIKITLSFFANLQTIFGEEIILQVEHPIRVIELFFLFKTKDGIPANSIFLHGDVSLNDDYNILLDGRNIQGFNGIKTIINEDCFLSFFPKVGGG